MWMDMRFLARREMVMTSLIPLFFCLYRCPPWTSWLWSAPSCTAWPTIPTPPRSSQGADLTLRARHTRHLLHTDTPWACRGGAKWAWVRCSTLNSRCVNKLKCCIFLRVCLIVIHDWVSPPPSAVPTQTFYPVLQRMFASRGELSPVIFVFIIIFSQKVGMFNLRRSLKYQAAHFTPWRVVVPLLFITHLPSESRWSMMGAACVILYVYKPDPTSVSPCDTVGLCWRQ